MSANAGPYVTPEKCGHDYNLSCPGCFAYLTWLDENTDQFGESLGAVPLLGGLPRNAEGVADCAPRQVVASSQAHEVVRVPVHVFADGGDGFEHDEGVSVVQGLPIPDGSRLGRRGEATDDHAVVLGHASRVVDTDRTRQEVWTAIRSIICGVPDCDERWCDDRRNRSHEPARAPAIARDARPGGVDGWVASCCDEENP